MSYIFAATDFDFETLLAFLRVAPASDTMADCVDLLSELADGFNPEWAWTGEQIVEHFKEVARNVRVVRHKLGLPERQGRSSQFAKLPGGYWVGELPNLSPFVPELEHIAARMKAELCSDPNYHGPHRDFSKWQALRDGAAGGAVDALQPQAVPERPQPQAVDAWQDIDPQAYLAPRRLAELFGVSYEALRGRLRRWQEATPAGGWMETTGRKQNEPKFLFQVAAVRPIIDELKTAASETASERPAKKN